MKTTNATHIHPMSSSHGWSTPRYARRAGSALLIVIGTLALIAVFAVVYLSIGRTDRRTATAVRTLKDQQVSATNFGEYFAGVIGADRLDATPEYDGSGNGFGRREVTDAPYTDWTRRSESALIDGSDLFTPIGGPFDMGSLTASTDYRVASDPWLASTTSTFLGDPGPLNTDRPFSSYEVFDPNYPNAKNFIDNRDWLQISNFAPDGRFVNLFNLRSTEAPGETRIFGSFHAEPGTGVTVDPATGRRTRRMSEHLTLLRKENPSDANSLIQAFDPAFEGIWLPGKNTPVIVPGLSATDIPNTPAVWTMYQRFMAMPINQPFLTLNRQGDISTWADPDFPAYQYADADGDGIADSRWFELVAARNLSAGNSTNPRDDVETLYDNDTYRYFIAARAVDLSSMVNVNTATDLLTAPTINRPLGLTPADVDLRRLLTMQDAAGDYTAFNHSMPLSYAQLHRPFRRESDNEPMWGLWNSPRPARDFARNVSDYWLYQHDYLGGGTDIRQIENITPSMLIGRFAYDALRQGIVLGGALDPNFVGFSNPASYSPPNRQYLLEYERNPVSPAGTPYEAISAQSRIDQYRAVGQLDPTRAGNSWARDLDYGSGLYGMDDLAELLTFYGLNDPDVTSRLERVTQGRYESDNGDELQTRRMGPLMSNRPLELDREQHGLAVNNLATDNPSLRPNIDSPNYRSVNGQMSFNSMAHFALTPRNKLTVLSGSVPLLPERVTDPSIPEALTLSSTPANALLVDTRPNSTETSLLDVPTELFGMYSRALAGELDPNYNNWLTDPDQFSQRADSTLFYGHRGAELALRVAAHTAVNMKDLSDSDGDPTIATLIVDNTRGSTLRSQVAAGSPNPTSNAWYQLYPGAVNGNSFDLDPIGTLPAEQKLANGDLPDQRQVVNVFGFEAMPVITEVSVLYAYTDAPNIQYHNGDRDWNSGPGSEPLIDINNGQVTYPPAGSAHEVTIDGNKDPSNDDYLVEVLAFQLHNPYDEPISLGGTGIQSRGPLTRKVQSANPDVINTNANYTFDYYIEYAGRFYKLAEYIEWYPTVNNPENFVNIDNAEPRYFTVNNPTTTIPTNLGGRMDPGTETSSGTTPGSYSNQPTLSDFNARNVTLAPRETRVFYVIADKRFDDTTPAVNDDGSNPDDRWTRSMNAYGQLPNGFDPAFIASHDADNDSLPDGPGDFRGWTGPAEQWVRHQFHVRGGGDPVMMMEFDPRDGQYINETVTGGMPDPTEPATSPLFANRNDIDEVRLWKKVVTRGEESDDVGIPAGERTLRNVVENDMLVDRMEIPTPLTKTFNGSANTGITNTVAFREDLQTSFQGQTIRNDNTGLSYVQWKTVRRADSPDDRLPSFGEVTPWMVRSMSNPALTRIEHDTPLPDTPVGSDFLVAGGPLNDPETQISSVTGDFETHRSLRDLFDISRNGSSNEIIQTIALRPHLKSDVNSAPGGVEDDGGNNSAGKFPPFVLPVSNTALDITNKAAPEIFVSGDNVHLVPRLGDLLLAWGIGPSYSPDPTRAANTAEYHAEEWVTGPEAMAIAMGIDTDPDLGGTTKAVSIWKNPYDTTNQDFLLDDGHLVIDNFVSYLNSDTNETPPEFTPNADTPRGTGAPVALGVIDQSRAIAPIVQIGDPDPTRPTPPLTNEEKLQLALSRATFGQVNINTAPLEVLRLLPGLTPSRATYNGESGTAHEWWGIDHPAMNLPTLDLATPSENPDVAAAIVAYRDRTYAVPNTAARPEPVSPSSPTLYESAPLNLEPTDISLFPFNMRGEFPFANLPAGSVPVDRSTITGIDGIRPTPGFGSLGELMSVRIDPEFGDLATASADEQDRWNMNKHLSIQQYGFDEKRSGIDTTNTIMSQIFGLNQTGDTIDDYAERLSMGTAVLNTITVRSDFFAVWFVVQGYQESDVKNLRPEDPLVPSIQKRYLMVVDRTNVIEPGDQPKILMIKEVPL